MATPEWPVLTLPVPGAGYGFITAMLYLHWYEDSHHHRGVRQFGPGRQ